MVGIWVRCADDAYSTLYAMLVDSESDAMKRLFEGVCEESKCRLRRFVEVNLLQQSSLIHLAEKIGP